MPSAYGAVCAVGVPLLWDARARRIAGHRGGHNAEAALRPLAPPPNGAATWMRALWRRAAEAAAAYKDRWTPRTRRTAQATQAVLGRAPQLPQADKPNTTTPPRPLTMQSTRSPSRSVHTTRQPCPQQQVPTTGSATSSNHQACSTTWMHCAQQHKTPTAPSPPSKPTSTTTTPSRRSGSDEPPHTGGAFTASAATATAR